MRRFSRSNASGSGVAVVGVRFDSVGHARLGFDAVRVGDAAALLDRIQRRRQPLAVGQHQRGVEAAGRERPRRRGRVLVAPVDGGVGAQPSHQVDAVGSRCDRQHLRAHPFRELHGDVADAAAGAEDHQRFAGLEPQLVVQPAQGGDAVRAQGARLVRFHAGRDRRHVVLVDRDIFGIEASVHRIGVDALTDAKAGHPVAGRHHRARAVVADHPRELLLARRNLALADVGIPDADAGGVELDEDLVRARFGHRQRLRVDDFRTAETIDRGRLHRLGNGWVHGRSLPAPQPKTESGHRSSGVQAPTPNSRPALCLRSRRAGRGRRPGRSVWRGSDVGSPQVSCRPAVKDS